MKSPVAILYDSYGNAMAVQGGTIVPLDTSALIVSGTDDDGYARFAKMSSEGHAATLSHARGSGSYFPDPLGSYVDVGADEIVPTTVDTQGQLAVRGMVLTDELSFFEDFTGTELTEDWITNLGTGMSYMVAESNLIINTGTEQVDGYVIREGDFGPYTLSFNMAIDARISGQEIKVGFSNDPQTPTQKGGFKFDGTNPTIVKFVTQASGDSWDTTEKIIRLPAGSTTQQYHFYTIEVNSSYCAAFIDGKLVAKIDEHFPSPYTTMNVGVAIYNHTSLTYAPTIYVNSVQFTNQNQIEVTSRFSGERMPVILAERASVQIEGEKGQVIDIDIDGRKSLTTRDDVSIGLLTQILDELKKLNLCFNVILEAELDADEE